MWRPEIQRVDDVTDAALELFVGCQADAVRQRGRFDVVLSGGATPLPLFRALRDRPDLPWERTWTFWADERFVPSDDPRSNAGAARAAFLDALPLPPEQILAWPTRDTPAASAEAYAATLRRQLGDPPTFDLVLLGLGADGHTASLFPGSGATAAGGLTLALSPAGQPTPRLSLTPFALGRGRVVAFLVQGEEKRAALEATLAGAGEVDRHPARAITALERLLILTDLAPRPS